jgi:hypothetical protein
LGKVDKEPSHGLSSEFSLTLSSTAVSKLESQEKCIGEVFTRTSLKILVEARDIQASDTLKKE